MHWVRLRRRRTRRVWRSGPHELRAILGDAAADPQAVRQDSVRGWPFQQCGSIKWFHNRTMISLPESLAPLRYALPRASRSRTRPGRPPRWRSGASQSPVTWSTRRLPGPFADDVERYLDLPAVLDMPSFGSRSCDIRAWIPQFNDRLRTTIKDADVSKVMLKWKREGVAGNTRRHRLTPPLDGLEGLVAEARQARGPMG